MNKKTAYECRSLAKGFIVNINGSETAFMVDFEPPKKGDPDYRITYPRAFGTYRNVWISRNVPKLLHPCVVGRIIADLSSSHRFTMPIAERLGEAEAKTFADDFDEAMRKIMGE
jgi:hypothetical protein